ncbi:MAG: hypothetical protein PHV74_02345 [Dehalococcoidia bacterium]|nr:hypothetical protein [Dehalococcoidia bacterium]
MNPKWITGIAILSLAITVLTFHVYIDSEPKPVVEVFSDMIGGSDLDPDAWSYTGDLLKLTDQDGRCENPVWSPDGANIVFECDGWIYIADADQGSVRQLAEGFDPAFSPAGDEVLFVRPIERDKKNPDYRANGIEVLSVGIHDENVQSVARLDDVTIVRNGDSKPLNDYLVWSSSTKLAVLQILEDPTSRPWISRLAIWDIRSGELKYIYSDTPSWLPSWSPDEQKLVCAWIPYEEFGEGKNPKPDLWLIDSETGNLSRLTNTPDIAEDNPLWSPDGSKIVFTSHDFSMERGFMGNGLDRGQDICTIRPDGTDRNVITNRSVPGWMMQYENQDVLAWHPDGLSVAYFSWGLRAGSENTAELSQELWEIGHVQHEPDGGMGVDRFRYLIQMPLKDGFLGDISWSPSGDRIAFEWTPCEIIVDPDSMFGIHLQVQHNSAPNQYIYVLDVPEK